MATHSIKLCVQNTVSIARVGTVTVLPKHTQIHTKTTVESRLSLNCYTSPTPSDKGNFRCSCPLFSNLLLFRNLSAVISALQHQPMLILIPFVNVSYCVHIVHGRACVNTLSNQGH